MKVKIAVKLLVSLLLQLSNYVDWRYIKLICLVR